MNQPRPPSADRLASYHALVAGAVRIEEVYADADGHHLMITTMDEAEAIAIIPHACPPANRALLLRHIDIITDLLALLGATGRHLIATRKERDALAARAANAAAPGAKDYAAECAIKCAEPLFQRYLSECHDLRLPTDADKTATRVKSVLAIKSRKNLNTDPAAAARWRDMVRSFDAWRRS
ncbi:hypothetical protein [Martelella soudanensis]|uniref:hypothetical protein n=1 Tax=unclassified Martelella TaxID=2629616 RepID=UPI0015DFA08E|nr:MULTISPECIES: hypothetical protein [unclassified Martelella]